MTNCGKYPTAVSRKKRNPARKNEEEEKKLHERKITLTFFSRLKPHAFFEYHAYSEASTCAYGGGWRRLWRRGREGGSLGRFECLVGQRRVGLGPFFSWVCTSWCKRVPRAERAPCRSLSLGPAHSSTGVHCTDNPSQQLLYLFRHTRLHRADERVQTGGILIPIISVWLGGVRGIIGLGRPSGLHMFPSLSSVDLH